VVEDCIKFIDILHYVHEATRQNNTSLGRKLYPSTKNRDWKNSRLWYETSDFEVLWVHDLLQHFSTAGEITLQG